MIYPVTILIILALLAGWLLVQAVARRFSTRHPEFDVAREEGCGGCMNSCGAQHRRE